MKKQKKLYRILALFSVLLLVTLLPLQTFAAVDADGIFSTTLGQGYSLEEFDNASGTIFINPQDEQNVHSYPLQKSIDDFGNYSVIYNFAYLSDNPSILFDSCLRIYADGSRSECDLYISISNEGVSQYSVNITSTYNGESEEVYNSVVDIAIINSIEVTFFYLTTDSCKCIVQMIGEKEDGSSARPMLSEEFFVIPFDLISYVSFSARLNNRGYSGMLATFATMDTVKLLDGSHRSAVLAMQDDFRYLSSIFGAMSEEELQRIINKANQDGYLQGRQETLDEFGDLDEQFNDIFDQGLQQGYDQGYHSGYTQGVEDASDQAAEDYQNGYTVGYNKGHMAGMDEGRKKGIEEANSVPKTFDIIGRTITKSLTIFSSHGNLFGYSLLDLVVTIIAVALAWWVVKKVT